MTPAHLRALSLFDDYQALSGQERREALERLRAREPDTCRLLAAMLQADTQTLPLDTFPEDIIDVLTHAPDRAGPDPRIGTRLGPWKILRVIAQGGMGTVYEAERDDGQYIQRVAIKCIRREATSPQVVSAFLNERSTLAGFEHPFIAPLLDGGIEANGHPWFAMRFIDGKPIDAWCDQQRLRILDRVRLLASGCDAIAHAHARGIIHHDIKPSNLLVTDDGNVHVVDFGLAAALGHDHSAPHMAVSPGYMAPETPNSPRPAAAHDIYSLGMVMFRLLCGRLPPLPLLTPVHPARGASESLSSLAAGAPADVALARGMRNASALKKALSGDLDAIAARSAAIDPGSRYASVSELSDDLRHWLRHEPVHARNGGTAYRAMTLIKRHRLASALTGLVLITAAIGAGINLHQTRHAAREAESLDALSRIFEQTLGTATLSGLGDTPMSSHALLQDTEQRVRSLSLHDHPRVLARGLLALARNHAVTGNDRRASELADEAALLQGDGNTAISLEVQATRAALRNRTGQPEETLRITAEALSLSPLQKGLPLLLPRLQLMIEAARAHWDLGQQEQAWHQLDQALEFAGSWRDTHPEPYIELLVLRGQWHTRLQRYPEADADLREAIALTGTTRPLLKASAERILVRSLAWQQRFQEAEDTAGSMLQDTRRVLGDAHPLTANALLHLGSLACNRRDFHACRDSIERGEAVIAAALGKDHPEYGISLTYRAMRESWEGKSGAAIATTRQALSILQRHYPPDHETVIVTMSNLAGRLVDSAPGLSETEKAKAFDEAQKLWEQTVAKAEAKGLPPPARTRERLARLLMEAGTPRSLMRAESLLLADQAALAAIHPLEHFHRSFNQLYLGQLYLKQGRLAEADAVFKELQAQSDAGTLHPFSSRLRYQPVLGLAEVASRRGEPEEALVLLRKNLALLKERHPEDQRALDATAQAIDELERTGKLLPLQ